MHKWQIEWTDETITQLEFDGPYDKASDFFYRFLRENPNKAVLRIYATCPADCHEG